MDLDAGQLPAGATRHRHVDISAVGGTKAQERGGGSMRKDRTGAAGHDRRQPMRLARQKVRRDDGVDTGVEAVKAPGGGALLDNP